MLWMGLSGLNITFIKNLRSYILSDKLKNACFPQHKEHFLDIWIDLNDPNELVEKLDTYVVLKSNPVKSNVAEIHYKNKNLSKTKETVLSPYYNKSFRNTFFCSKKTTPSDNGKVNPSPLIEDRSTLNCYVCEATGFIQANCPSCSLLIKSESSHFELIQMYTCSTTTTS